MSSCDQKNELKLHDLCMLHSNAKIESLFGAVQCATLKEEKKDCKTLVAVKMSNKTLLNSKKSRRGHTVCESPENEAKILKALKFGVDVKSQQSHSKCPYVIEYLGSGEVDNFHYVLTEYCEGGELFDLISCLNAAEDNTAGGLHTLLAKKYFVEIATGVSFIHQQGVVHLDLSLENVILHEDSVKIIDFGMARSFQNNNSRFRGDRGLVGKEAYCSPEVFNRKKSGFDGRKADVWSLGILLFMMLSGSKPIKYAHKKDARFPLLMNDLVNLVSSWELTDKIDATCVDLLKHIFCPEKERYSISQVLAHPFCQDVQIAYTLPQPEDVPVKLETTPMVFRRPKKQHSKKVEPAIPVTRRSSSCPQLRSAETSKTSNPNVRSYWQRFASVFSKRYGKFDQLEEGVDAQIVDDLEHRQETETY